MARLLGSYLPVLDIAPRAGSDEDQPKARGTNMKVSEILHRKGTEVATVKADDTISAAVRTLAEHGVGALVVSADGAHIDGIISERDIVRSLDTRGASSVDDAVATVMTATVHTCALSDDIDQLMQVMTERRIRHIPVTEDGVLVGIISIGDVVKRRLDQLEDENRHLNDYISGR